MENKPGNCELSDEDLRAALKEMRAYVDITEEDLKRIYAVALRHAEKRATRRIPVRDVMTESVIKIRVDAAFSEAAHLLSERKISGLPVVDEDGRVVGIITEGDILSMAGMRKRPVFKEILRHILGEPLPASGKSRRLRDAMSSPAITIGPEADIQEAALKLDEKRIRSLPVVDEQGRLLGVISRADIVRAIGTT